MSLSKRHVYGILAIGFAFLGVLAIVLFSSFSKRAKTDPTNADSNRPLLGTSNPQVVAQGIIDVTKPWTSAGTFKGRIVVIVDGKAILHPAEGPVGPEGDGKPADNTFPLPGESAFCAVAKFRGHVEKVGAYKELFFDSPTELFLGPNDEFGQQHGPGFSDNSGSWSYKILSPDEIKAKKEPRTTTLVVKATEKWQGSGMPVNKGDIITISATGSVIWDDGWPAVGPDGAAPAKELQNSSDFPVPEAGCGSLVMQVGQMKYAVGRSATVVAGTSDPIEFMVNDRLQYLWNNKGNFTVSVSVEKGQ